MRKLHKKSICYLWRLNSFLIQKNYTASNNSMLHVVTGNAKIWLIKNKTLTMRKLHKKNICYFHHCSYIGLLCIFQIYMNAIIFHYDNARIVTLINILIIYLCSFGIDVATPWYDAIGYFFVVLIISYLIKLNVIVLQVELVVFTRELVAVVHQWSSNHSLIDVYNIVSGQSCIYC